MANALVLAGLVLFSISDEIHQSFIRAEQLLMLTWA